MRFRVLGALTVEGPGGRPVDLKGLRQRAVLAVLLSEGGRPLSSEQLADLVWDGEPPPQAAGTLQAYISRLRRLLEPGRNGRDLPWQTLETAGRGYRLNAATAEVDSLLFESLCRQAAAGDWIEPGRRVALLSDALELWRGEPYAEFRYFTFARSEVHRLEELRWWAVEERAEARLDLGDHRQVVAELADEVGRAPYRERLRGLLMLALYRSGRQADAIACYQQGRSVLVEELGIEPGPDLRRLEQTIIEQDPGLDRPGTVPGRPVPVGAGAALTPAAALDEARAPASRPGRPAMVGRREELERTRALVEDARAGRGGLLLVTGEAGIGKTRLAEETARWAEEHGVAVSWGHSPEMEGAPPLWPWVQLLRDLVPDAGALPPPLRSDSPPVVPGAEPEGGAPGSFQLYEAARRLLEQAAARRPTLLVVEDLHWSDVASLRLLRYLCAGDAPLPVAVLATAREEHQSAALADLESDAARSEVIGRLALGRLSREAAEELVAALTGDAVPDRALDSLLERSGGNPFFLSELVRLGAAGVAGVPQGVRDVIRRRRSRLSEPTQRLLGAAACCVDRIDLSVLAEVLDQPAPVLLDQAEEALAAKLLREVPDRAGWFQFSHPLLRDAIAEDISRTRQAHLHRRLAEVLEARLSSHPDDSTVAALAHHYATAAPLGTLGEAIRWGKEAARRDLGRWAAEDAMERVARTLDLARSDGSVPPAEVIDLLILRARAQRFLGDDTGRASVVEAMDLARSSGDPRRVVEAALALGRDAWGFTTVFGAVDEHLAGQLAWALPEVEKVDPPLWVEGTALLAGELVFSADPDRAAGLAGRALTAARRLGDPAILQGALQARWVAIWGPETLSERTALVAELDSLGRRAGLDPARTLMLRWSTALEAVDPDETERVMGEVRRLVATRRHPALEAMIRWRRSLSTILDGRFSEAEELITANYEAAARFNPHEAFDAYSGQLASMYWLWGRIGELTEVLAQAIVDQPYNLHAFGPAHALALVNAGRTDEARARLHSLSLAELDRAPASMLRSGTTATLAVACAEVGERDLCTHALRLIGDDRDSPAVVDHVGVFYMGSRAAHRGRLHLALGQLDDAVPALERGLAVDSRAPAAAFALKDGIDLGESLLRRGGPGDAERARQLVAHARAEAARLGTATDLARAEALVTA
ncbi:MAG TPA: BTAD domain-containing putative transcriptional regulator [Acidimicrobiales bacterium]|nr:BTAD domain-containing putative transcriptional regulator [Acidimicrobiales bacterium]